MEYFEQKEIVTSLGNMVIPYVREEYIVSLSNGQCKFQFMPITGDTVSVSALHVTEGTNRESTNITEPFYFIGRSGTYYLCERTSYAYRIYTDDTKTLYQNIPLNSSYPSFFPITYYDESSGILYNNNWDAYYSNTRMYTITNTNDIFGNLVITFVNYSSPSFTLYSVGQDAISLMLKDIFANSPSPGPTPEEDPYAIGGETEKAGGEGDFDTFSDEIPVPELPTVTVDNTGFISLYSPSIAQLKSLASYLWASTGLDLDTFKRIFTDPISTILGLTIVPVTPTTSGSSNVVLGNVSTGVSMPRISNQYVQFDCGTLNVNEFWGGYLDYSPYTSLEIYLPFIGTKPLNIDDVMGHTIHLVYNIDLLSGACCAIIESARRVLYQFIGQCSCSVPVTGRDMTNLINGILSVVGAGAGTFVATGGNPGLSGASAIGALASNVSKSKPKVEKSGSMGSMGGMLGVRCPYLIITRPRQALPASQNRYTGYPSFITCVLSDLVGYTEIYKVHLGDIPATDAEKAEIETLLMNGVIL